MNKQVWMLLVLLLCILVFAESAVAMGDVSSPGYNRPINYFANNELIGQCTWYAWGRAYEKLGIQLPCRGNAKTWDETANNYGYTVGTEPRANSIAVWNNISETGHVAFVESVDWYEPTQEYLIHITQYNWLEKREPTECTIGATSGWLEPISGFSSGGKTVTKPDAYIYLGSTDTVKPVITGAFITNRTSEGYDVVVTATDNQYVSGIQIGTWHSGMNVDNAKWSSMNATYGKATLHVSYSDFNNPSNVTYYTNAYAFDSAGNVSDAVRCPVIVDLGNDFYATVKQISSCGYLKTNGTKVITAIPEQAETITPYVWHFIKQQDEYPGSYAIISDETGKCWDIENYHESQTNINLLEWDDNRAQKFYICYDTQKGSNQYFLSSVYCRCAVDVPGSYTDLGAAIWLYTINLTDAQIFSIETNPKCYVYYDANGGKDAPPTQTKNYKNDLTLSTVIPTRAGYTFLGWAISPFGTVVYQPGDTYSRDANVTLYAIWQSSEYTITYDANGGVGAPPVQMVNGGSTTLSSVEPTRAHYGFLGWAANSAATAASYAPGSVYSGGSITLYAVWQRKLENVMILPDMLTEIEEEAFIGTAADAFVIPANVSVIGQNAFDDVAIYGYTGSYAETYANANGLTFIPLTDEWVLADAVPGGATVTDEKWTYILTSTETTTSTETSLPGWTQAGFTWQKTGTGTWKYASFPTGFDTESPLYSKYNKSALGTLTFSYVSPSTTKRVVSNDSFLTYIYWHWTFVDSVPEEDNHNVLVEDAKKLGVNISGSVYRDFIYFDAFESTTDYGTVGPGQNGMIDVSPLRYAWRGIAGDASQWWWRFEVYQQTYTDYQKLFTYVKDSAEILESDTEPSGEHIHNVQHWVKYSF